MLNKALQPFNTLIGINNWSKMLVGIDDSKRLVNIWILGVMTEASNAAGHNIQHLRHIFLSLSTGPLKKMSALLMRTPETSLSVSEAAIAQMW